MPETEESLRERALAAWQERKQEMAVEAERRETEQKLRAVKVATQWAVMVLNDDGLFLPEPQVLNAARRFGIEATDPRHLHDQMWTVDISAQNMTFRWSSSESSIGATKRFELVGECPDCGSEVTFGYRIANLYTFGVALDEQLNDPKGMHRCAEATDVDDSGEPMVPLYREKSQDPADVLLDALQGYIHAAVRAAVDGYPSHGGPGEEPF